MKEVKQVGHVLLDPLLHALAALQILIIFHHKAGTTAPVPVPLFIYT